MASSTPWHVLGGDDEDVEGGDVGRALDGPSEPPKPSSRTRTVSFPPETYGEEQGLQQTEKGEEAHLLGHAEPSKTRRSRRQRREQAEAFRARAKGTDALLCGLRPGRALLIGVPGVLLLLFLVNHFPSLSRPNRSQQVDAYAKGRQESPVADGPWASVGTAFGTNEAYNEDEHDTRPAPYSNGTAKFRKTVIIVSLDGVRPDYLERSLTPNLVDISEKGLKAEYMKPVFPSLTFPNHWALATGLYAESHGIVANDFYDPSDDTEFVYTDSSKSWASKWWGGEPIWSTAVKAGIKTANLMWPGPPMMKDGTRPTYFHAFENNYHWSKKLDVITRWIDMPLRSRPQLIMAYLPEVDQEGHRTGPDSDKLQEKLTYVDDFAKALHDSMKDRNLHDLVDIIFVSDHGMTDTNNERLVLLDEVLGEQGHAAILHKEGWPSCGLRFNESLVDTDDMLKTLREAAKKSDGGFAVYTHQDMPERWHFSGNPRIAPIYVVPETGWVITDKNEFYVDMNGDYHPKGNHGYDPDDEPMHAIFVAHGPMAEHIKTKRRRTKRADQALTVIEPFHNLEIYNLLATLLQIEKTAPNNGTVGFWSTHLDL
ncbi:uncharacterized protein L969DRAFT_76526 [Mixia osmundae IAM 14324]|uniref:Sulfatase N-terminal domain-containing protein n=1 Tax=Mixia osmundae (strain CBS 9802 / IAM 14324 / JCM 22182 / KY 12970) TaxID=764103 RepID=G7E7I9_MIXOS|nr:uncharacterized protein L969DRAFT_76526 [Mixia osmundae IAM 14324]KEI38401.1 hypothetical protein L969DRAFT_76526 [Mixia osmundae IAM 14324]GAA98799.1 hypothetical protein E5Q_05487 [Mixia osmundae IAM 14324]